MFEYIGPLHMHSVFPDGSGEVPEIAKFLQDSSFAIHTDVFSSVSPTALWHQSTPASLRQRLPTGPKTCCSLQ